jgi:phosphatidate cytidylyltransferase
MAFSDLKARVITAGGLAAGFVLVLYAAVHSCFGRWILFLLAAGAVTLCAYEFARMRSKRLAEHSGVALILCSAPSLCMVFWASGQGLCEVGTLFSSGPFALAGAIVFFALCSAAYLLWFSRDAIERLADAAPEIFIGYLLIGCGGGFLTALAALPNAPWLVAWLFLVICLNDIAAYFGGSRLQGRKLAPAISPNKTISGSLCGLACGALAGVYAQTWLGFSGPIIYFLVLSVLIVLAGQSGDLLKSYVKRRCGVKDSGSLFPGHGGILDRIDGVLLGSPLLYIAVVWTLRF